MDFYLNLKRAVTAPPAKPTNAVANGSTSLAASVLFGSKIGISKDNAIRIVPPAIVTIKTVLKLKEILVKRRCGGPLVDLLRPLNILKNPHIVINNSFYGIRGDPPEGCLSDIVPPPPPLALP